MRPPLIGYVASSAERYSGPIRVEIRVAPSHAGSTETVASLLRAFVEALDAGYFYPGTRRGSGGDVVALSPAVLGLQMDVHHLPRTSLNVLAGLLLDAVYQEKCCFASAHAVLDDATTDLLVERLRRPAAVAHPPFEVDLPDGAELGHNTLLIEVEFRDVVPPEEGETLLAQLAILETLWLAYPVVDEDEGMEPVESLGAQRHFHDPRTIHHYEFAWDADPMSWNLLVNLCCAWSRTRPVARLRVE